MGVYLNSSKARTLYRNVMNTPYFVDKSALLREVFPLVESGKQSICITRPRRFGKTVMANMVACFFGKGESGDMFSGLNVAEDEDYKKHLNHHNVIYITFNEMPRREQTYETYMERIESRILNDLLMAYPDCGISVNDALWDALNLIHEHCEHERFIFVFDEWDFVTEENKRSYVAFLSNLLKDQPYVEFAYMTGILPIAKYSSGSELNMFLEYTMASKERYGDYFGFTEKEVDMLYLTFSGEQLYNPRSVVSALQDNQLADYWTSSGPYDEIFYYVKNNIADVRDDIAHMVGGEAVSANVKEYAAVSTEIKTRDQILSAMVVYGFLAYDEGKVRIPNRELMDKFVDMVTHENELGYVNRLAKESERMFEATRSGDTKTMETIMRQAHDTETGMMGYNSEAELSAVVKLVYLAARDQYDIQREDKAGVGFVDYIFYPILNPADDCLIVELKVDHTAEEAIQQIKPELFTAL